MGFGDIATAFIFSTVIMVSTLGIVLVGSSIVNDQTGLIDSKSEGLQELTSISFEIDSFKFEPEKEPSSLRLTILNDGGAPLRYNDLSFYIDNKKVEEYSLAPHPDFKPVNNGILKKGGIAYFRFFGDIEKGTRQIRVLHSSGSQTSKTFFFDSDVSSNIDTFKASNFGCSIILDDLVPGFEGSSYEVSGSYSYNFENNPSDVSLNVSYFGDVVCTQSLASSEGEFSCSSGLTGSGPFMVEVGLFEDGNDFSCIDESIGIAQSEELASSCSISFTNVPNFFFENREYTVDYDYTWEGAALDNEFTASFSTSVNTCSQGHTTAIGSESASCNVNYTTQGSKQIDLSGDFDKFGEFCSDSISFDVHPYSCTLSNATLEAGDNLNYETQGPTGENCFLLNNSEVIDGPFNCNNIDSVEISSPGEYELDLLVDGSSQRQSCGSVTVNCPVLFDDIGGECIYTGATQFGSGLNDFGQVGSGNFDDIVNDFEEINDALTFTSIHAGIEQHACGVELSGDAYCWGHRFGGRLGIDEPFGTEREPALVVGGYNYSTIGAGTGTTCAILTNGSGICWGLGNDGIRASGDETNIQVPEFMNSSESWIDISLNRYVGCGIDNESKAYCWGQRFRRSHGIQDTSSNFLVPTLVDTSLLFKKIDTSSYADSRSDGDVTCAITVDDELACWGHNSEGALGRGTTGGSSSDGRTPTIIASSLRFSDVSVGAGHVCSITTSGDVYCQGRGDKGQLGIGNLSDSYSPTEINSTLTFESVAAGEDFSCASTDTSDLYCWGNATNGTFGSSSYSGIYENPTLIDLDQPVKSVSTSIDSIYILSE